MKIFIKKDFFPNKYVTQYLNDNVGKWFSRWKAITWYWRYILHTCLKVYGTGFDNTFYCKRLLIIYFRRIFLWYSPINNNKLKYYYFMYFICMFTLKNTVIVIQFKLSILFFISKLWIFILQSWFYINLDIKTTYLCT